MFAGLCAFPLTPMVDDAVDEAALVHLVSRAVDAGVSSLGVLGSTGVYPYLDRDERRAALVAAVGAAGNVPVIAGVGALRTRDVHRYAEDAQDSGASGLLVAPVSYHRLGDEEVYRLYRDLSANVAVPIVVYDNPTTTGFTFDDRLYARIAELPNIASIKIPPPSAGAAGERVARLREALPEGLSLGVSGDWAASEALLAGCDAWYSVLAGLFPEAAMALFEAATARNGETARALSAALEPLWALFRKHGSLRVTATIAELLGFVSQPCLPRPLDGLAGEARADVEHALLATGLGT